MRTARALPLALVAAVAVAAPAATVSVDSAEAKPAKRAKAKAKPKIKRVTPMRVEVGRRLVVRGRGFKPRKRRNTVIFRGAGGRTAFAKPRRATRRKLVVKVPASVARLLVVRDGRQRPTRLRLRVLAGRFSAFTPAASPQSSSASARPAPAGATTAVTAATRPQRPATAAPITTATCFPTRSRSRSAPTRALPTPTATD